MSTLCQPSDGDERSAAKISRPRLPEVYPRTRLFDKLDAARARPVVWITGPAGSGKTTLAGSYLEARELPCLWYQIDERDADVATFFYYLSLAGYRVDPGDKEALPRFSAAHARGVTAFSRNFFTQLFERLPRPAMLVLDNYQEVADESDLQTVMRVGLETVPAGCHLVFLSRQAPPPELARAQANGWVSVLGWQDLQLSRDEAEGVLALRQSATAGALAGLDAWLERLQGWVAGLVLVVETLEREVVEPEALNRFLPETIFDYFVGELFAKARPAVQTLLLQSALLPKMSEDHVCALTGDTGAAAMLDALHRRNFFVTRHTNGEKIYQYHPLFRDFLLARGQQVLSPDERLQLKRQAAQLLEGGGQAEAAIELLADCQEWPRMAALIKANAKTLMAQGRGQTLAEWIIALPQAMRAGDPWLTYWLGACLLGADLRQALACFEHAFVRFRSDDDVEGTYRAWCGAVHSIGFDYGGSHKRLDPWLQVLQELMGAAQPPSPEIELQVAKCVERTISWRAPTHPSVDYWHERLPTIARQWAGYSERVEVTGLVLLREFAYGDRAEASVVIEELEGLLESGDPASFPHVGALAWVAWYRLGMGQLAECQCAAQEALGIANTTGITFYNCHLMTCSGAAALVADDSKLCQEMLRQMVVLPETSGGAAGHFYHQLAAAEAMTRRDYIQAYVHAQECLRTAAECGFPYFEAWGQVTYAMACFETERRREAEAALANGLATARSIGAPWVIWGCLRERAYFAVREREPHAQEALRQAFSLAREQGYMATPGVRREVLLTLSEAALRENIEVDYARRMIATLRLHPQIAPRDVEHWPWPLKVHTLGRFAIHLDDKPLEFSGKAPKKPLQLIKSLIALGGQDVSEQRLADSLWPDAEGDAARRSLTAALHRLRKLIGDKAITQTEGRLSLDPCNCWVDVWAFDRILGDVSDQAERDSPRDWALQADRAFKLYQGQFLTDEPDAPWSGATRDRLQSRFVRLTCDLACHWEQLGAWEKALEYYRRGLELDNVVEAFYQGLIRSYGQLGLAAEAMQAYRRCQRQFSIAFGVAPSATTERICRAALGK